MRATSIGEKINAFIAYKRSLGYVYGTPERYLRHYQNHMEETYPHLTLPEKGSTDHFLDKYQGQSGGLYNAIAPLREFSRYLFQIGYSEAYLVPPKQMPKLHPEPPYFFTEEELSAFFRVCDSFYAQNPGPRARGDVMPAVFRLLYCCGLRPKEARMLPTKNVQLAEKYIDIIQSKGPKSRRIHISDELATYLAYYDNRMSCIFPERMYFFPRDIEKPYSVQSLCYNFRIIWKQSFPEWTGSLPRIYDVRYPYLYKIQTFNHERWFCAVS
jgi:integrase